MSKDASTVIVVGVDRSEISQLALAEAIHLAARTPSAELHVGHVITPTEIENAAGETRLERIDTLLRDVPEELWARILGACRESSARATDLSVTVHVRLSSPAEGLLQLAADYDADLLVVGSHGRGKLERFLLGSVASELVRVARCPVLVVRPTNYEGVEKTPRMDPPGPGRDAASLREPHLYVGTRSLPFGSHNSNTLGPTGVRMI